MNNPRSCLNCGDFDGIVKRRDDGVEIKCSGPLKGSNLFLPKIDPEPRCSKWRKGKERSE